MSTIERPHISHQVVINMAGFLASAVVECDRWPLALSILAEVVPTCPRLPVHDDGTLPLLEHLVRAAETVLIQAPTRRMAGQGMDWALAMSDLRAALAAIFWARASMAHAVFAPQTQDAANA